MSRQPPPPALDINSVVTLGDAPEVLAVGPEGVGPTGTVANVLYAAEAALRDRWPRLLIALRHLDLPDGRRRLVFALHPAGGPIELTVGDDGAVRLTATTALAGPGYHRFLFLVARVVGQAIGIRWRPRGPRDLEDRFLGWLQHHAREALSDWLSRPAAPAVHWLRPLAPGVGHWQGRGAVATVVGSRSEAWLQAVVADPQAGIDAFPWWETGLGPSYKIGRARCVLWRDLRWRLPTCEEEVAALAEVANLLAEAWDEAPARTDLPWRSWLEVLDLLVEAQERRGRVAAMAASGPPEGYRRHLVREPLPGGWHLTLPGRMGVSWSEAEGWVAWDEGRTAWFSVFEGEGLPPQPEHDGVVVAELVGADQSGRILRLPPDEDGVVVYVLSGHVRSDGRLGVLTLAWQADPLGRAWAEAVWWSVAWG